MELLELSIYNMSQPASLSPAVHVCMKMKDFRERRTFVNILLKHGAKGQEVNQALIDAVEESSMDKVLIESLLEKADFEYLESRAILTVMRLLRQVR